MILDELKMYFTRDKILRDTILTFVCLLAGLLVLVAFFLLALIPSKGSAVYHLLDNLGIFFLFSGAMLAYAAVHRGNAVAGEHTVRSLLVATARQAHVITGILLGSVFIVFAAAFAELVLSLFGYIPYAGPVIVALLSVPLFAINAALIAVMVLVWVSAPPMVAEGIPLKRLPFDFLALTKKKGLVIFGYTMLSLIAFALIMGAVLIIVRYAAGITRSVQWNISPAYPSVFKAIMRPSYVTDIIGKVAPKTDPIAALQQYGTSVFNYVHMLGNLLKFLYGIVLAALASFILGLFFNTLSFFYTKVKRDVIK
ncbi:MAG: hypothetical protein JXA07_12845 [Spirochaetes bacterium]|nr:hypothetical protein [Spirochaetota bacterium]